MPNTALPIWDIHDEVVGTLRFENRLVLVAPTGSGKTTQVPQMLLDTGIAGTGKIVILQPRRVAARTVAARVAWERKSPLGAEVGYQIRFDDQTSLGTRICFVTEGILLRWLQDDASLRDISVILFDEFHERNLLSDVALALVKRLQRTTRPDLKLAVMSATLDAKPVAEYLGGCDILVSEGQSYPVDVRYLDSRDNRPAPEQAADIVADIVRSGSEGDILVFMPGMAEINATLGAIRAARTGERLALIPLHGDLPPDEQDAAFAPNALRKVVVSTNVAETSVTIDGIRHVVDSGLARVARYDAERGINTLFLEPISRASADQRKGRAGRTAPGTCHRLWTESSQLDRPERNTPEIQRSDLAEVVLLLHSLGIRHAAQFDWLDKPDPQAIERAEKLLCMLGALSGGERGEVRGVSRPLSSTSAPLPLTSHLPPPSSDLTDVGRRMLRLPMHPRYSRMLVEAASRQCLRPAAMCCALVSGRDLLARVRREDTHGAEARELFETSQESDFFTLMRAFEFAKQANFSFEACRRHAINAQVARQVDQTFDQINALANQLSLSPLTSHLPPPDDALQHCIMAGFIDQLAVRRDSGTLDCDMTEGRRGALMRESVVQQARLLVIATIREVSARGSNSPHTSSRGDVTLLGLATAVKREWIEEMFPQHVSVTIEHVYDQTHRRVAAIKRVRFADLVIHQEHLRDVDPEASGRALAEAARSKHFELPLLTHETRQFIARINLVCAAMPQLDFPVLDESAVLRHLGNAFRGLTLAKEAQATELKQEFFKHLAPEQLGWLEELAPISLPWPDGRRLKLLYQENARDDDGDPNGPELQIKLTECFALKEHPHLCEGHVPVKLWLATPEGKRLDSTFDWLAWKKSTYPKHRPALQKKFPGSIWP